MTRRMIDQRIWESETVASLTMRQRLLWVGVITTADDQGRGKAHPGFVRARIFPLDDVPMVDIEADMQALADVGLIILYDVNGSRLYQVVNWWEYQRPTWAWPSDYAPPDGWVDRVKYRKGNLTIEDNWESDGGLLCDEQRDEANCDPTATSPRPHDDPTATSPRPHDDPTATPQRPHDEATVGSAPSGSDSDSGSDSQAAAAAASARAGKNGSQNAFRAYERACGMLSPLVADQIGDLVDEFETHRGTLPRGSPGASVSGDQWVVEAITEMIKSNPKRRNLRYIQAILGRWKRDGYKSNGTRRATGKRRAGQGVSGDGQAGSGDDGRAAEAFAAAKRKRKRASSD